MLKYWVLCLGLILNVSCNGDFYIEDVINTRVVVDSFIQEELLDNLDVLVVIDTSCSMTDDQERVAVGIEELTNSLGNITYDFQIGFINDNIQNITYAGPYDSQHNIVDFMIGMSMLQESFVEQSYFTTTMFLSSPDLTDMNIYLPINVGVDELIRPFARTGVPLLIFIVSDEDEQSTINSSIMHDWLLAFKGEDQVDVVTIASTEAECSLVGFKYMEISQLFGKDTINICDENWENWLADASFLTHQKREIYLSDNPIEDSIVVYLDGNSEFGWRYKKTSNSVLLDVAPEPSTLVEVGYKVEY